MRKTVLLSASALVFMLPGCERPAKEMRREASPTRQAQTGFGKAVQGTRDLSGDFEERNKQYEQQADAAREE